jgi:hypothetical protein
MQKIGIADGKKPLPEQIPKTKHSKQINHPHKSFNRTDFRNIFHREGTSEELKIQHQEKIPQN